MILYEDGEEKENQNKVLKTVKNETWVMITKVEIDEMDVDRIKALMDPN